MSGLFDETPPSSRGGPRRRAAAAVARARSARPSSWCVLFFLGSVFTGIWTDRLWFKSVGYSEVFNTMLGTRVLLFIVFGRAVGAVVAANIAIAYRFRPVFRPASQEQVNLDRYREVIEPMRKWLLVAVAAMLAPLRRQLRLRPVAPVPAVAQPARRSAPRTPTSTRTSGSTSSSCPGCTTSSTSAWRSRCSACSRPPSCTTCSAASACRPSRTGSPAPRRCTSRCCSGCSCSSRPPTTGWTAST